MNLKLKKVDICDSIGSTLLIHENMCQVIFEPMLSPAEFTVYCFFSSENILMVPYVMSTLYTMGLKNRFLEILCKN